MSVPTLFQLFASDAIVKSNLQAFLLCFDIGTAPAVGYTRTVVATNVNTAGLLNDWSLLEGQAAATNVDLIAKGTINGQSHGLFYQPAVGTYLDADIPPPGLQMLRANGIPIVRWPFSAAGFTLQSSTSLLPAAWTNETDPVDITGNQNSVTLSRSARAQFYRLEFPFP